MTTTLTTGTYAEDPATDRVHLVNDDDFFRHGTLKTLCGKTVHADWDIGDETRSGHISTCRPCRVAFAVVNPNLDPDPSNTI